MRETLQLMAAPTSPQPGGYVRRAYADRDDPTTKEALLGVRRDGDAWRVDLEWSCDRPVQGGSDDPAVFCDAAALLAPSADGANWATMGEPGLGVEGVLWRADRRELLSIRAEGLGTVRREAARPGWAASADWRDGRWRLSFVLPDWPTLDARRLLGVAIWRGARAERAGLKSISQGWVEVRPT